MCNQYEAMNTSTTLYSPLERLFKRLVKLLWPHEVFWRRKSSLSQRDVVSCQKTHFYRQTEAKNTSGALYSTPERVIRRLVASDRSLVRAQRPDFGSKFEISVNWNSAGSSDVTLAPTFLRSLTMFWSNRRSILPPRCSICEPKLPNWRYFRYLSYIVVVYLSISDLVRV